MTPAGARVLEIIDTLVRVERPLPDAIGAALHIPFPLVEHKLVFDRYQGTFPDGPFVSAELKYVKERNTGGLILEPRPELTVARADVNLEHFGPLPPPEIDPYVPPEGTISYTYRLPEEALELAFAFTHGTKVLQLAVVTWLPAAKHSHPR